MNIRNYSTIFVLCLGVLGVGLLWQRTQQPTASEVVTVGMMSGWPPFMTINNQGAYEGFDVDVAQELARRMHKKLVIKDLGSLAPLFIALQQGKIDMIMSGLDITQDRLKKMAMVQYTGEGLQSFYLLFWQSIPENITKLDDFKQYSDVVIGVEPGSASEKYLDQFDFIKQKSLPSVTDMMMDLKYGKSRAVILEPQAVGRLKKLYPNTLKILTIPLEKDFQTQGEGIALAQKNKALIEQTQDIIQTMKQDGTLRSLEIRWNLKEEQQ